MQNSKVFGALMVCAALGSGLASTSAHALELSVKVIGSKTKEGKIGCALYLSANGFPHDNSKATRQLVEVNLSGSTCVFTNLVPGTYAVGVVHDMNGNEKVDTNLFGLPIEAWAVSNNVAPRLRAPRYDEAAFKLEKDMQIELRLIH
jgi:uncharacterized protein (DUF2141 family)